MPFDSDMLWSGSCTRFLITCLAYLSPLCPYGFIPPNSRHHPRSSILSSIIGSKGRSKFICAFSLHDKASSQLQNYTSKDGANPQVIDFDGIMSEDEFIFEDYCEIIDDFGCEAYENISNLELSSEVNDPISHRWVRVEAKPDEMIRHVNTADDVFNQIAIARERQSKHGPSNLYGRRWEEIKNSSQCDDEMKKTKHSISVMQFNILAEGLSSSNSGKTPFRKTDGDGDTQPYGGFSDILEPSVALDFSLRRWRLIEVILGGSIERFAPARFDIVALEEIDRFRGFFQPILRIFGYRGIFVPKVRAPGLRFGWYSDGCALFWKTDTFELVSERRLSYRSGNQVMLLATFRHRMSGRLILVAATHLKAQKSEKNELIRCAQADELLEQIRQEEVRLGANGENVSTIVMGDFNSEPPCVSKDSESSIRRLMTCLNSAYPIDPPRNDFYTTWKTRGKTFKRVIDYIFYGTGLKCNAILSVPNEEDMEAGKLPGLRYPSDHMMIAAQFEFD